MAGFEYLVPEKQRLVCRERRDDAEASQLVRRCMGEPVEEVRVVPGPIFETGGRRYLAHEFRQLHPVTFDVEARDLEEAVASRDLGICEVAGDEVADFRKAGQDQRDRMIVLLGDVLQRVDDLLGVLRLRFRNVLEFVDMDDQRPGLGEEVSNGLQN